MNEKEPIIDRSKWGSGPWDAEPDRVDFEHAGFACLLLRHPRMGHWCGYVGVPSNHAAYGKGYNDVEVDVHGGLTYANQCSGRICHVPSPGMPDDVWWLGFDCAHAGDFSPSSNQFHGAYPWPIEQYDHEASTANPDWRIDKYRTVDWVRGETERLADQLAGK